MYINYHKHTDESSITTPDTFIKTENYFDRIVELGHNVYFTTEHGYGGDIFKPFTIRDSDDKYKDIKICFGVEAYITSTLYENIRDNYHIVILAKTNKARRKINKIISKANKEQFYYKARITVDNLLTLDPDDVFITNACIGGILRDDTSVKKIAIPLIKHFKENFLLEIQNHNDPYQKEINKKVLSMAKEYNLKIVHANDSHYIYPEQGNDRLIYLKGKGVTYDSEDAFTLDYPDENTILERYKIQGVVPESVAKEALNNTNIFSICEEIDVDKSIKMPNIYKDLTPKERMKKLEDIVYKAWEEKKKYIAPWKISEYEEGIELELDIIRGTNDEVHTADYFLINKEIIDEALRLGGVLTPTGRGSAVSFFINHLLGFTKVNRFEVDVPLYPTRFMSKSRLLETKSLPDIDFNLADQEPFVKASRNILGENSCYPMLAYGTMQVSESFRNYCRWIESYKDNPDKLVEIAELLRVSLDDLKEVTFAKYNDIAKDLESLEKEDKIWKQILKESEKFVGSVISSSQHPCSFLIYEGDIEEELSVIKVGEAYCVPITSVEVEDYKYLKNDYLMVSCLKLIDGTFKEIGKQIPSISELINNLTPDVWDLYHKGITATLNQVDSNFATGYVMQYKPKDYKELSAFVAGIRPGFKSLLSNFINRKDYTTGNQQLDEVLSDTQHYMMYQESIMKYLIWLGVEEDKTYGLIKKIAKKTLTTEQLEELHGTLEKNWIKKTGSIDGFQETWQTVEDASR